VSSISVMAEIDRRTWDTISDEEIVRRVRSGDTALYEVLMRRYNQRLYRIGRSILAMTRRRKMSYKRRTFARTSISETLWGRQSFRRG
jgi:1,2-phenylacetyl-CoA epoxidase PaaB subunit